MRKIKFRVWDLDNQEMYYQDDEELDFIFWHFDYNNIYITEVIDGYDLIEGGNVVNEHKPNQVVMQFTGLHDMNGKEIYEGDVIVGEYGVGEVILSETTMSYKYNFALDSDDLWLYAKSSEIIGNIHETPELLGENNDNK